MGTARDISQTLASLGTPERATASTWFFKTGPGQYGEGDKFYGVTVPQVRATIKQHGLLTLAEVERLLASPWHEARLAGCLSLVNLFKRGDEVERHRIYEFYLTHTDRINNWDLVDCSAGYIVGQSVDPNKIAPLIKLARSKLIWDRRIAIIATLHYIQQGEPGPTLAVAELLVSDEHDLIHKAVGWMLREVGKRVDEGVEQAWLLENDRYKTMPRTMLRYAIERFAPEVRKRYLAGTVESR